MREAHIEKAVCAYAVSKGFYVYKFSSPGVRGVPDRMLVHPSGTVFFIEFKTAKGKLSAAQIRQISKLQERVKVGVISDIDEGMIMIDSWCAGLAPAIPEEYGKWSMVLPRSDKIGDREGRYYVAALFDQEAHAKRFCSNNWPETGEVLQRSLRISTDSHRVPTPKRHLRSVDSCGLGKNDSDPDFPGSNKAAKDADSGPDTGN